MLRKGSRWSLIDTSAIPVIEVPYSIENGRAAMTGLLNRSPRPTVVLCGNDVLAVGALRATRAAGLDVPGDISITGFDDIELAEIVEPGLTTVHVPHRQMGTEAARMIVALLGGEELGKSSPLATRIVHRESLGPV